MVLSSRRLLSITFQQDLYSFFYRMMSLCSKSSRRVLRTDISTPLDNFLGNLRRSQLAGFVGDIIHGGGVQEVY